MAGQTLFGTSLGSTTVLLINVLQAVYSDDEDVYKLK